MRTRPDHPRRRGTVAVLAAVCGAILLAAAVVAALSPQASEPAWGVTYSPRFAASLGLDPRRVFHDVLDDLGVRHIRLPVYWDDVEPVPGGYDFSDIDWYLSEAARRDAQVVLVVGYKQPRWPECYAPAWAADLPAADLRARILALVEAEVRFAQQHPNVAIIQVENEPFRQFGECRPGILSADFVAEELRLVHSLDPRPTVLTDSGELPTWLPALRLSQEYFGTVIYRQLHFPRLGFWQHPVPPWHYAGRDRLDRLLQQKGGQTIIIELQAEAWFEYRALADIPPEAQQQVFPASLLLESNVEFARQTGFPRVYLWGVEWWAWMEERGYPEYREKARALFRAQAGTPAPEQGEAWPPT